MTISLSVGSNKRSELNLLIEREKGEEGIDGSDFIKSGNRFCRKGVNAGEVND